MAMAWAPGRGHAYLGRPREGLIYPVFGAIGVAISALAVPTHEGAYVFYGGIFMLFSMTWSCIWVNEICNQMGLPHSESYFEMNIEMHWNRNDILEVLLFFLMPAALIATGHFITNEPPRPELPAYVGYFDCIAVLFPVAITLKYALKRLFKSR